MSIKIALHFEGKLHQYEFNQPLNQSKMFETLDSMIRTKYPLRFHRGNSAMRYTYEDDEGDVCEISCEEDLRLAINDETLTIHLIDQSKANKQSNTAPIKLGSSPTVLSTVNHSDYSSDEESLYEAARSINSESNNRLSQLFTPKNSASMSQSLSESMLMAEIDIANQSNVHSINPFDSDSIEQSNNHHYNHEINDTVTQANEQLVSQSDSAVNVPSIDAEVEHLVDQAVDHALGELSTAPGEDEEKVGGVVTHQSVQQSTPQSAMNDLSNSESFDMVDIDLELQSVKEPVAQPVNQSVSSAVSPATVDEIVYRPADPLRRSVSQSVNQPHSQSISMMNEQSVNHFNQSFSQSNSLLALHLSSFFSEPAVIRTINQATSQSIDLSNGQSIDDSGDQLTPYINMLPLFLWKICHLNQAHNQSMSRSMSHPIGRSNHQQVDLFTHPLCQYIFARANLHFDKKCAECSLAPIIGPRFECQSTTDSSTESSVSQVGGPAAVNRSTGRCRVTLCERCASVHESMTGHLLFRYDVPSVDQSHSQSFSQSNSQSNNSSNKQKIKQLYMDFKRLMQNVVQSINQSINQSNSQRQSNNQSNSRSASRSINNERSVSLLGNQPVNQSNNQCSMPCAMPVANNQPVGRSIELIDQPPSRVIMHDQSSQPPRKLSNQSSTQLTAEPIQYRQPVNQPIAETNPQPFESPVKQPSNQPHKYDEQYYAIVDMGFVHSVSDRDTVYELLEASKGNIDQVIQWMVEKLNM